MTVKPPQPSDRAFRELKKVGLANRKTGEREMPLTGFS